MYWIVLVLQIMAFFESVHLTIIMKKSHREVFWKNLYLVHKEVFSKVHIFIHAEEIAQLYTPRINPNSFQYNKDPLWTPKISLNSLRFWFCFLKVKWLFWTIFGWMLKPDKRLRLYPEHHKAASEANTWRHFPQCSESYDASAFRILWISVKLRLQFLQALIKLQELV